MKGAASSSLRPRLLTSWSRHPWVWCGHEAGDEEWPRFPGDWNSPGWWLGGRSAPAGGGGFTGALSSATLLLGKVLVLPPHEDASVGTGEVVAVLALPALIPWCSACGVPAVPSATGKDLPAGGAGSLDFPLSYSWCAVRKSHFNRKSALSQPKN